MLKNTFLEYVSLKVQKELTKDAHQRIFKNCVGRPNKEADEAEMISAKSLYPIISPWFTS